MTQFEKFPLESEKFEALSSDPLEEIFLIRELKKANVALELIEEVKKLLKDDLTGLLLPKAFREIVEEKINQEKEVAMFFLDLRFLKAYNDNFGHEATNLFLKELGKTLEKEMVNKRQEKVDIIVSRYGGDEFILAIFDQEKEKSREIFNEIKKELQGLKFNLPPSAKKLDLPFVSKEGKIKMHFYSGESYSQELKEKGKEVNFGNLIDLADRRALENRERYQKFLAKKFPQILEKIQRYGL